MQLQNSYSDFHTLTNPTTLVLATKLNNVLSVLFVLNTYKSLLILSVMHTYRALRFVHLL